MEEKKYVYVVSTGVVGVDDRRELGRFKLLADAITFMAHRQILLLDEAKIESQQVHYREGEFTQFDVQIDRELLDEDDCIIDDEVIAYVKTPKFRYGKVVD